MLGHGAGAAEENLLTDALPDSRAIPRRALINPQQSGLVGATRRKEIF
jgi:hypothetical protein